MAFDGEMPTAPLIVGGILSAPIWIPGLALWGAYQGIKAGLVHGIIPGAKKIAAAGKRELSAGPGDVQPALPSTADISSPGR